MGHDPVLHATLRTFEVSSPSLPVGRRAPGTDAFAPSSTLATTPRYATEKSLTRFKPTASHQNRTTYSILDPL